MPGFLGQYRAHLSEGASPPLRIDVTISVKEKLASAGIEHIVQLVQKNEKQGGKAIEFRLNQENYAQDAEEIDFARSVSDRFDQEAKSASKACNTHEELSKCPTMKH